MHGMRNASWTLIAALALGCSFDAGGGGASGTEGESDSGSGTDTDSTSASASASATASATDSAGSASSASGTTGDSTTGGTSGGSATTGDPTGDPTGTSGGSGGTTGPGTASATTGGSTTDPGTTGDPTTGGSTGATSGGSTSGGVACEPPPTVNDMYWVEDAIIAAPMQTTQSQSLPGMPTVAYSEEEDDGTVTFEVDIPCEDDYRVWGLVWDRYNGTQNPSNADSFYFNTDGQNEITWAYGCQTFNQDDAEWSWLLVQELAGNQCPNTPDVRVLSAGSHHLNFRNREQGDFGEQDMAAIAAIVVTNDPAYDPNTDYQP